MDECEAFLANWGYTGVRLVAADALTASACAPARDGFYLHDSSKGYSAGCIEVESAFFAYLRGFLGRKPDARLILKVDYTGIKYTSTNLSN